MAHSEQHEPLPNPLDVLCDIGIPSSKAQSIVKKVTCLTLSQKEVDLKSVKGLTSIITPLSKDFSCLGDAFFTIAKESHNQPETETVVWLLCALICMHPVAKHCVHDILLNSGFRKIAEVLFFNSMHNLSDALERVNPEKFETIMQLVFAFLAHYPNAYVAHMPDMPLCTNV